MLSDVMVVNVIASTKSDRQIDLELLSHNSDDYMPFDEFIEASMIKSNALFLL